MEVVNYPLMWLQATGADLLVVITPCAFTLMFGPLTTME